MVTHCELNGGSIFVSSLRFPERRWKPTTRRKTRRQQVRSQLKWKYGMGLIYRTVFGHFTLQHNTEEHQADESSSIKTPAFALRAENLSNEICKHLKPLKSHTGSDRPCRQRPALPACQTCHAMLATGLDGRMYVGAHTWTYKRAPLVKTGETGATTSSKRKFSPGFCRSSFSVNSRSRPKPTLNVGRDYLEEARVFERGTSPGKAK